MSGEGMSQLRPRVLTLHYCDTSMYRSLLLEFPGPLQAMRGYASSETETYYAQNIVTWLNSLTPKIEELASITEDCSCEVRVARANDTDAVEAHVSFISGLSKRVSKLQAKAEAISYCFERYVVEMSSTTKTADDDYHEKETNRANLKHRCTRLESNVHNTRVRVSQTEKAIEELRGIHKLAVFRRIRTRSQLGFVRITHCISSLFGTADKGALVNAKKKSMLAAKVEKRIRHDRDKLIRRHISEMEDLTRLAGKETMVRHALACYSADMRNLGGIAYHLRIVTRKLQVAGVMWQSVAKTFEALGPNCSEQCTEGEVFELWQTVSVLTRSFLEGHLDSISNMSRTMHEEKNMPSGYQQSKEANQEIGHEGLSNLSIGMSSI